MKLTSGKSYDDSISFASTKHQVTLHDNCVCKYESLIPCDDELEKSGNEYIPMLDKSMIIFIDDLSMPYINKWGDQVTLELVRQLLEFSGYYLIKSDENRGVMKKISKFLYFPSKHS